MSVKSKARCVKQSVAELRRVGVRKSYLGRMVPSWQMRENERISLGGIMRDNWQTGERVESRDGVSVYVVQADGSLRQGVYATGGAQ